MSDEFFIFDLGGVLLVSNVFFALVKPVNVLLEQSDLLAHELHLDLVELDLLTKLCRLGQGLLILSHV